MPRTYGYQGPETEFYFEAEIHPFTGAVGGRRRREIHAVEYYPQYGAHGVRLECLPARVTDPAIVSEGLTVRRVDWNASTETWDPGASFDEVNGPPAANQFRLAYAGGPEDARPPGYLFLWVDSLNPAQPAEFTGYDVEVIYQAVALLDTPENHIRIARAELTVLAAAAAGDAIATERAERIAADDSKSFIRSLDPPGGPVSFGFYPDGNPKFSRDGGATWRPFP